MVMRVSTLPKLNSQLPSKLRGTCNPPNLTTQLPPKLRRKCNLPSLTVQLPLKLRRMCESPHCSTSWRLRILPFWRQGTPCSTEHSYFFLAYIFSSDGAGDTDTELGPAAPAARARCVPSPGDGGYSAIIHRGRHHRPDRGQERRVAVWGEPQHQQVCAKTSLFVS